MPDKLDRCVADVKSQGGVDNPWAVCNASLNKEKKTQEHHNPLDIPFGREVPTKTQDGIKEKVNANRQVPFFNPPIKKDSNKPDNRKTTKGMGGTNINKDSFLWKDIFDAQLRQNVKEPRF